jgi:hypothetical protein
MYPSMFFALKSPAEAAASNIWRALARSFVRFLPLKYAMPSSCMVEGMIAFSDGNVPGTGSAFKTEMQASVNAMQDAVCFIIIDLFIKLMQMTEP